MQVIQIELLVMQIKIESNDILFYTFKAACHGLCIVPIGHNL